jgi:hypothetical protein
MLENSRDILNWALALSSLTIAFFICWGLYYLISTFRRGFHLIKKGEGLIFKVENLIDSIKSKVSSSASYLFMITELVKKVSRIIKNKQSQNDSDEDVEEEYEYEVKPKNKGKKRKIRL